MGKESEIDRWMPKEVSLAEEEGVVPQEYHRLKGTSPLEDCKLTCRQDTVPGVFAEFAQKMIPPEEAYRENA